jgi:hypothetical protein
MCQAVGIEQASFWITNQFCKVCTASGLPVLGLVDWNPAGVAILLSYKFGNQAMGLEAGR